MNKAPLMFTMAMVVLTLMGCSNSARLTRGKPLKNMSVNQIIEAYEANAPAWDWIGMKLDVAVAGEDVSESFKASVRIARDSVIWMSISPALGVEVARVLLAPDSVLFISKIPGNRFYYAGNYDALSDWADMPLRYSDVQSIFTGQPMDLDPETNKFISRIDGDEYALIGKYKRRVKRVVGVPDNDLAPEDSLNIQLPLRRYERLRNRAEDEELLIQRHWFDGRTFDPVRDQFDDLYYQRSLVLERSRYEVTEIGRFPGSISVLISTVEESLEMKWDIMRIRFDRAYDFPFEIPEDYEQRTGF